MRYRVGLSDEAKAQRARLAPGPKRLVRGVLREMETELHRLDIRQLDWPQITYRVREGDYRILFRRGPGVRELSVIRIGHRSWAYEGFERSSLDE